MWATTHIKRKFFASLRTTSRCEALHAQLGRFVESESRLSELLHHFNRCMDFLRNKEVEVDLKSTCGFPMMQTHFEALERSVALVYTREVFYIFRSLLLKASTVKVVDWKETKPLLSML